MILKTSELLAFFFDSSFSSFICLNIAFNAGLIKVSSKIISSFSEKVIHDNNIYLKKSTSFKQKINAKYNGIYKTILFCESISFEDFLFKVLILLLISLNIILIDSNLNLISYLLKSSKLLSNLVSIFSILFNKIKSILSLTNGV